MKQILFLVQLPPPLHGAALINKFTVESKKLAERFKVNVIPLIMNRDFDDLEKRIQLRKLSLVGSALGKLTRACLFQRPDALVLTLSLESVALIRDVIFIETARLLGVNNIVLHLHGTNLQKRAKQNSWTHSLYQQAFRHNKAIILSERLYPDVAPYIKREDIKVVHNGTMDPFKGQKPALHGEPDSATRILFLSNLSTPKGTLVLLEALGQLHRASHDFVATFAGPFIEQGLQETFEQKVIALGLKDKVRLTGPVYDQVKHDTFSAADIFVFPTLNECFPVVLLEASAYGLPIVASLEGGIPDIVAENISGLLFEKGNVEALAESLEHLVRDKVRREKMGNAARDRFVNMFTLEHYETNITQAIEALVGSV